jgi:hypothetical protein
LRAGAQNITKTLLFLVLSGVGSSLGCVDLTRPWERPGYGSDTRGKDARGNFDSLGGGGSPGQADVGYRTGPDAEDGATAPSPERPVDGERPQPQWDDGGLADSSPNTRDGGLADASLDTRGDSADAGSDATSRPTDGSGDLPAQDSRTEANDAPLNGDRNLDLSVPVPDSRLADTSPLSLDVGHDTPAISGLLVSYPCERANGAVLPDTSGHDKNATLANGSGGSSPVGFSFGTGRVGNALTLSPQDQAYASLPRGILSQLSQVTIATWVKLSSSASFQRIFDFGVDTNTFMYLVNAGSNGGVRFRIVSTPLNKNQVLEGANAIPTGRWTHVALTLGDNGVSIYLDGAQVAEQAPVVLRPTDLGDTSNNFIGRSPFVDDPYLDGQIDEFRIYDRVLNAAEIGALANGQ